MKFVGPRLRLIDDLLTTDGEFVGALGGLDCSQFGSLRLKLELQRPLGGLDRLTQSLARLGTLAHATCLLLGDGPVTFEIALRGFRRLLEAARLGLGLGRALEQRGSFTLRVVSSATRLRLDGLGLLEASSRRVGIGLRPERHLTLRLEPVLCREHGLAIPTRPPLGLEDRLALAIDHRTSLVLAEALALERVEGALQFTSGDRSLVVGASCGLEQVVTPTHGLGRGLTLPLHMRLDRTLVLERTLGLLAHGLRGKPFGLERLQRTLRMLALRIGATKRLVRKRLLRLGPQQRLLRSLSRPVGPPDRLVRRCALCTGPVVRLRGRGPLAIESVQQRLHHPALERGTLARRLRKSSELFGPRLRLARDRMRPFRTSHRFLGTHLRRGTAHLGLVGARALLLHRTIGRLDREPLAVTQRAKAPGLLRRGGGRFPPRLRVGDVPRQFGLGLHGQPCERVGLAARILGSARGVRRLLSRRRSSLTTRRGGFETSTKLVERLQRTLVLTLGAVELGLQSLHRNFVRTLEPLLALSTLPELALVTIAPLTRLRLHAGERLDACLRLLRLGTLLRASLLGFATRLGGLPLLTTTLALDPLIHEAVAPRRQLLAEATDTRGVRASVTHALRALAQEPLERGVEHVTPTTSVELELDRGHAEALRKGLQGPHRVVLMTTQEVGEFRRHVGRKPGACQELAHGERRRVLEGVKLASAHEATRFPGLEVGLER